MSILWGSVWFNFYAIFTLIIVAYTVITDKVHGPMLAEERLAQAKFDELNTQTNRANESSENTLQNSPEQTPQH